MAIFGTVIVFIIMACMVIGAFASMIKPDSELGKQWQEGVMAIGPIFIAVAGIFAAIPYLSEFCEHAFGSFFTMFGADPALAATTIIAVDMGGYQLADAIAATRESWIMAMFTGYLAGATIVYSVPIGLRMVQKKDHKYFALGIMAGFVSIPIGVFVASAIAALSNPMIRQIISTSEEANYQLQLGFGLIFRNLIPLIIICVLIAIGLKLVPNGMVKGFMIFGTFIDYAARVILVGWILEIYTGLPTLIFGSWGFDPIMADGITVERCVEICCYVALMLSGAFPLVYLIQTYLSKPIGRLGKKLNLSQEATTGFIATMANTLAMYPMVKLMRGEDKVKVIAFAVCGSFLIGDHLSFTANFQPNLILPVFVGKLVAALSAVLIALVIAVPKARQLWIEDQKIEEAEASKAAEAS
jgi:ethanolamine transporter